jgi:hypothetical protein
MDRCSRVHSKVFKGRGILKSRTKVRPIWFPKNKKTRHFHAGFSISNNENYSALAAFFAGAFFSAAGAAAFFAGAFLAGASAAGAASTAASALGAGAAFLAGAFAGASAGAALAEIGKT